MSTATITRPVPPHPQRFHVRDPLGQLISVKGKSITVPGMEEFDLFLHLVDGGAFVVVSEGKTGGRMAYARNVYRSDDAVIQRVARIYTKRLEIGLPPLKSVIEEYVGKWGLTPRWTP